MEENSVYKTFLGANTAYGFCSCFGECYNAAEGFKVYILKGGPGTGKSTVMKSVAGFFMENGDKVELCPCSSDPDSLDSVIIKTKKAVVLDGTAPHTVEPKFPGVCENIINLGECFKKDNFEGNEDKIIETTLKNKSLHADASRYIVAAGKLYEQNYNIALSKCDTEKAKTYFKKLAKKVIARGNAPKEEVRFLSTPTPKGMIFLKSTVQSLAKTVIAVNDNYGAAADIFTKTVRQEALEKGNEIITFKSILREDGIDHIIIPSQSLAFCTEGEFTHPDGITKRIYARRFINMPSLAEEKAHMKFNESAAKQLLFEAVNRIGEAKAVHDELEKYYVNAMDFSRVAEITNGIISEIKNRPNA